MLKKDMPTGIVLYEGKSRINKEQIVVLATGFKNVENHKTGQMIQIWIMHKDLHPCSAKRTNHDYAICGDCKHRDFKSCYVELRKGPIPVWNTYKKGTSYVKYNKKKHLELFKDRAIRFGAYGDPINIPLRIMKDICSVTTDWTGYTHQWKRAFAQSYKPYFTASVDSITGYYKEYYQAIAKGWKTFRIKDKTDTLTFDEEMCCPASEEMGKLTTCSKCLSCCGSKINRKNAVIAFHGHTFKYRNYIQGMKKIKNKKGYRLPEKQNPIQNVIESIEEEIKDQAELVTLPE